MYRIILDSQPDGASTLIYDVSPDSKTSWLVFQALTRGDAPFQPRRRLPNPPADWATYSDAELMALVERAGAVEVMSAQFERVAGHETALRASRAIALALAPSERPPSQPTAHAEQIAIVGAQVDGLMDLVARLTSENDELRAELEITREELRQMNLENQVLVPVVLSEKLSS